MRKFSFVLTLLIASISIAQELNCNVAVIAQQTGNDQNVIFKNLERQLTEFVNTTKWTEQTYAPQERINCSMVINVNNYTNDSFTATLQVSSSRPVFNSTYQTPVYNFNDEDFNFRYLEFQNLVFNAQQFESNLVSILAFHVYMILGMDADTFKLKGGEAFFKQAQTIVTYSQQSGSGWRLEDGLNSRFALMDNLLSDTFEEFRTAMYNYHLKGLDTMANDTKGAKTQIANTIVSLKAMHNRRPNSFLMRVFFDAKSDEILDIFSNGPNVNIAELKGTLQRIAPIHSQKWRKIKF